eukprot:TRINITY_DN4972_c0_g1_i1.p1 TRINITY_DN4972_c0_g1~~TRINITY_DN4972_c0_g1_i1.p1  ORF type:complete len:325 (-),score=35.64 TRINITY_DN4972_c0_g1_i1:961-1935(-)
MILTANTLCMELSQRRSVYVVLCKDKCVVIDTGCGVGDIRGVIASSINTANLPYVVVCTHSHFDHIGGVYHFSGSQVCAGAACKAFTQNFEINSLAAAHPGASVRAFPVSKWLAEGDLIYFDDANPTKEMSLEVLWTPGHTPDSISLFSHWEKRLFVGDLLYPFSAVHVDCLGSNTKQFLTSINRLKEFMRALSGGRLQTTLSEASTEFLAILNLDPATVGFDVAALIQTHDGSLESAIAFYLTDPAQACELFPLPELTAQEESSIVLSCGHVEANLPSNALDAVAGLVAAVRYGQAPVSVDGEYAEYTDGMYSLLLPRSAQWE